MHSAKKQKYSQNFQREATFDREHITLPLVIIIIIKFAYNARSDWLEQSALTENREQVDDITSWPSKFLLIKFDKCGSN